MDSTSPLAREELVPFWNAAVYGACLYLLGFGLLKAALVMTLVLVCVALNYGARWILRGGFALLVLTVLLWLGVLPPVDSWPDFAAGAARWMNRSLWPHIER
jgi:hypothetical protein